MESHFLIAIYLLPFSSNIAAAARRFSRRSLMMGTTLISISTNVIKTTIKVDKALIDGFTRLLMVYTKIEILLTPLPVTK